MSTRWPPLLVSLACFAGLSGTASAASAERLLERLRPQLAYDTDETFYAQPVSLPPESAEVLRGDRVYGHIARQDGETWLQYWFFFAYNPQDRGILGTGRHEGDWELAQFRLAPGGRPDLVTLSQHSWAEGCAWKEMDARGRIARLYVAEGSHALYSRAGVHDRPWPDPNDEADGEGRVVRPNLTRIGDTRPAWVADDGRWGATEASWVPGESDSPRGPRFQESDAWAQPASYHAEFARECGSGPPGRWWATAGALGLAGAVAGASAWVYRRLRESNA